MQAESQTREMGDSYVYNWKLNHSSGLEIAGKIIITVMLILFFTVVLIILLHLYFKCYLTYLHRNDQEAVTARLRRRRLDSTVIHPASTATSRHLDPSILNSIPLLTFSSKDKKIECAVCLSETLDGDKIRILPKCNHGFHVECIDTWFESNSTCPICRNTISNQPESKTEAEENSAVTSLSLNSEEPSSSSPSSSSSSLPSDSRPDKIVVIEMPRRIDEDEETKSPVIKQLKSFKRLLSMGTTRVSPSSSSDSGKMGPDQC